MVDENLSSRGPGEKSLRPAKTIAAPSEIWTATVTPVQMARQELGSAGERYPLGVFRAVLGYARAGEKGKVQSAQGGQASSVITACTYGARNGLRLSGLFQHAEDRAIDMGRSCFDVKADFCPGSHDWT